MKQLFQRMFAPFITGPGAVALLLLRCVIGFAFMLHGWGKIQQPFSWMGPDTSMPRLLQALAALSEFGGGLAWILGLLTPLASLGIISTMAVATWFMVSSGGSFVGEQASYELPLVYLVTGLVFLFVGPGSLSIDAVVFRRKDGRR